MAASAEPVPMPASARAPAVSVSALEALELERQRPGIVTFCRRIDEMLPGEQGIPTGKVTEICGMAGIGKTQLWYVPRNRVLLQQYVHSMQLCANVQIPTELQGLGGAALFIDTEGSFSAERFQDIAQATVAICNSCLAEDSEARLDLWRVLNNVKILRVFSQQEQIDVINGIEDHIRMTPRLRLIVIDSIALHFRHTYRDIAMRSRMLTGMAQTLRHVAEIHDIAIVITNQMTTKIVGKGTDEETALMVPALGESWAHACTNRVILLWHQGYRHAWLCKSPNAEDSIVPYAVSADGIRDQEM